MTFPSWPTSGRTYADLRLQEIGFMLRKLQQHPLLAGLGEVLVDAMRYVAVMVVLVVLLGYLARLAAGAP
jgi:predicted DNA repair protein MutK